MMRIQKEEEEAQQKKLEAVLKREQEQQELIKEKEREILQLQVIYLSFSNFFTLESAAEIT